ncbi:hypothetical protein NDU88_001188 [Pleurodeles waltl]|uniref:ribonuclease H n=1 Tax=Pleurodeles waltl TaxID=8319 RepID=A0AAV7UVC1_PLEWA|nr:hypothetical protein NDU88_001188 [Pleurodeles waltl]
MLSRTRGMKWFSTIDLKAAYHQVRLHPSSRDLTAFITPFGCYRFRRVPFGLPSAAAMFQRLMCSILAGINNTMVFQDDILVMGRSRDDHDQTLLKVLNTLDEKGLTAEFSKCKFACDHVNYLGHVVSAQGIKPKEELLSAIRRAPSPHNKDEVRAFLGLVEFYSKFVNNFSTKTYDLRQLLKTKNKFLWSEACQNAFDMLKNDICNAPPLQGFDSSLRSGITTDASCKGIGAVLTQINKEGYEDTIAFASRSLTTSEEKYSVIEREALACVWAMEHFRQYVWGTPVILRCDHKPLVKVLTTKGLYKASPRLARLSVRLFDYNYVVQYLPGVKNTVADFLSRMPLPSNDIEEFQNTNEDGTEDMWVAIVEEGICKERRYVVLVICNSHRSRLPRARDSARATRHSRTVHRETVGSGLNGSTVSLLRYYLCNKEVII